MKVRLRMGMPRGQGKAWPTSIIYTVPGMPQESVGRGYVFTPGRYAGAEEVEANATPFPERFAALQATLGAQFMAWSPARVAKIRSTYVDSAAVVISLAERMRAKHGAKQSGGKG